MILDFPRAFSADESERRVPDANAARTLLAREHADALAAVLQPWRQRASATAAGDALFARIDDAVHLAYARLAIRHGHLGGDLHAYHNERHILDICGDRLQRVAAAAAARELALRDIGVLLLFGAGHDLRQREASLAFAGVGANERASLEETQRILDICGFSRDTDADLHIAVELTIAGSTFDARPPAGGYRYNAAELVQSGGALAATLDRLLDEQRPGWRAESHVVHALKLASIAADLDTANVAEPFAAFAASAENLCREREMLSGRSLDAGESALPVLRFLTDGQDRFFFELHRFQSQIGRTAFEPGKQANADMLKALTVGLRARIALRGPPANGNDVIAVYREVLRG